MYFPDRALAPGLREQYEAKLALALKPQTASTVNTVKHGNDNSFAADFCFAPLHHFGIFASYRGLNHRYIVDNDSSTLANVYGGDFYGHRWEGGAGYFGDFKEGNGYFEAYAGYGNGSISRRSGNSPYKDYDARYHRYFVQAGLGGSFRDWLNFSGGLRFAFQRYYNFSSPLGFDSLRYFVAQDADGVTDVTSKTTGFIEPYINFEAGYKWAKFNIQWGLSAQTFGPNVIGHVPAYISVGLAFHFSPRYFRPEPVRERKRPKRIRYRKGTY